MAELSAFSFRSGHSLLHNMDVRFKLFFLMLISITALRADIYGLTLLSIVFAIIILHIRLSIISVIKEIRYFLILLLFVFIARALSAPGTPVFEFMSMSVSLRGIHEGILVCWRLLIVVFMGLSFMAATRASEIRGAVVWFLGPVPFIPEKRVGTMLSLLLRFIPVILNQAGKTAEAQKARGIELRKNPVYRLTKFTIPFMRRTFEDADRLVLAMEARSYSENRTDPEFSADKRDWLALLFVIFLCAAVFCLSFLPINKIF